MLRLPSVGPGTRVGAYLLQDLLGKGATGVVYRALAPDLGRDVAVKIIGFPDSVEYSSDEKTEIWARFQHEVAVSLLITHPHIVPVLGHGELLSDGELFPWLAMELVPGARTLSRAWHDTPQLDWLLSRTVEILETLAYVHAQDVIHRDIKPDNILIADNGNLFLVDFGLVRIHQTTKERITRTGQAMGTIQYMSLEQLGDAKHVDARADLYAVGMVLYDLLEHVQRWASVLPDIMCGKGVTFTKPVPAPLQAYVRNLTAPNRDNRPASAQEALDKLRTLRATR